MVLMKCLWDINNHVEKVLATKNRISDGIKITIDQATGKYKTFITNNYLNDFTKENNIKNVRI